MKPLNSAENTCNHTTSNCVIWQGPDIECINLCKGDNVTDVVFKLASELCEITNALDISSYDLSCFDLVSCQPKDFESLIQFLIERVCAVEKCTGCEITCDSEVRGGSNLRTADTGSGSGCPDCEVSIASCFYYTNEFGDTVTSMQLTDYVRSIGTRLCGIVSTITLMQSTLNNHELRIGNLESLPHTTYTTPQIVPKYVLPSVLTDIDIVLSATEEQLGLLRNATGTPSDIFGDISKQPAGLPGETPLDGSGGTMGSKTGWNNPVQNVADAIGNIWITIQDIRNAIRDIQLNCCPSGCDGVELLLTGNIVGDILTLYVNGTVPGNFVECNGITQVYVEDSNGNAVTFTYVLLDYLNNPTGKQFNLSGTPIDSSLNLTVKITACVTDPSTGTTCERCLGYHIVNEAPCPDVIWETTGETVSYSFTSAVGSYDYKVELWDAAGGALISSQIQSITGVQTVTGQFISLSPSTTYKVRVVITPTACPECTPIECSFTNVTTSPEACPPPTGVSAEIDYV